MSAEKQQKMPKEKDQKEPNEKEQRVSNEKEQNVTEKQEQNLSPVKQEPNATVPKSGTGAYAITVPVRALPEKDRKMSVKSADEHERKALPDKGIPPDFIWCIGLLVIIAIIFAVVAAVMFNVAKNNGILDLTRRTYEL